MRFVRDQSWKSSAGANLRTAPFNHAIMIEIIVSKGISIIVHSSAFRLFARKSKFRLAIYVALGDLTNSFQE